MNKKIILIGLLFIAVTIPFFVFHQEEKTEFKENGREDAIVVNLFSSKGCPHCAKEKEFLKKMESKYPELVIREFEVSGNSDNLELLKKTGKELGVEIKGVPFTVVGEKYMEGFLDEDTSGKEIEDAIKCHINNKCEDVVGNVLKKNGAVRDGQDPAGNSESRREIVNVPFAGEINVRNFSLPLLTVIIGGLDGFNPCAMWSLLFLISLLLRMENRKRMWILGSAFIIASALLYYAIMIAWLNVLLFIGFAFWMRIAIGYVAFLGGAYNIKEFFARKDAGCKVAGDEKRRRIFDRIRAVANKQQFLIALLGIILLAFAVNTVELICSAGLPTLFIEILAINDLSPLARNLYILLYIFVFMLDDLIVFFIAMATLQTVGVTTKYVRVTSLVGGIIMVLIGVSLWFKPAWLMMG